MSFDLGDRVRIADPNTGVVSPAIYIVKGFFWQMGHPMVVLTLEHVTLRQTCTYARLRHADDVITRLAKLNASR